MRRRSNNNNKQKPRKWSGSGNQTNPPSQAINYSGPVRTNNPQLGVIELCVDVPVTSTAGGVVNNLYIDYPNQSPDWTQVSALFGEYRVLSMSIKFTPTVEGATITGLAYAPIYVVWDSDQQTAQTALTSYTDAVNYASLKVFPINMPFSVTHKMSSVEEANFGSTSLSQVDYSFKYFATGLTASTLYGRLTVFFRCQFRGRR